jgi:hypothetical protein
VNARRAVKGELRTSLHARELRELRRRAPAIGGLVDLVLGEDGHGHVSQARLLREGGDELLLHEHRQEIHRRRHRLGVRGEEDPRLRAGLVDRLAHGTADKGAEEGIRAPRLHVGRLEQAGFGRFGEGELDLTANHHPNPVLRTSRRLSAFDLRRNALPGLGLQFEFIDPAGRTRHGSSLLADPAGRTRHGSSLLADPVG